MKNPKNKLYLVIDVVVGCVLFCVSAWAWDLFEQTEPSRILRAAADSATIPGVLMSGMAALSWVGKKGTFDIFGYSWSMFIGMFKRDSYNKRQETLYDYRVRRDASRKPFRVTTLMVGLAFLAIAIILTVIFLLIEPAPAG